MIERALSSIMCVIAAAMIFNACGAKQYPMPDAAVPDAPTLIDHVHARDETVDSARARAVMEYFGSDGRVRVRQALLVSRPGNFRLETLSPMDSTLAVVVTNDEDLTYYDLAGERAYTGAPTAQNLARLIPLWLSPAQIVRVVLGSVPFDIVDVQPSDWDLTWDGQKNAWRLEAALPDGGLMEFWVRHDSWVLAGARAKNEDNRVVWEIRTKDFERVSDGTHATELPTRIRFVMKDENLDASLTVKEYQMNPDLPEHLFELFLPDVEQISLDSPEF